MKYNLLKIYCKLLHKDFNIASIKFFRKRGIIIGNDCHIYSNCITTEPFLIEIKNNVTISTGVTLLTHDNAICKADEDYTDVFGKIIIGNNCFIGANSLLLPGIEIADDIIVGAGSVVSKSLKEEKSVYAGNPARRICSIEEYYKKNKEHAINISKLNPDEKKELIFNSTLLKR